MATYVLVPGAWLGAWAWNRVGARLREEGHHVHPVSLTGLGERNSEADPSVDLERHVIDVVDAVWRDDLSDVILAGHSYAGMVVTGAVERVRDRISQLVYIDSGPFPDGTSFLDTMDPQARQLTERLIRERGQGWLWPMPTWEELETVMQASLDGLGDREREAMRAGAVSQPAGTIRQPLRRPDPVGEEIRKVLVSSSFPLPAVKEMIAGGHPWFAELAGPEWRFQEVPTGHWPMFSKPDELAGALGRIALT
jgi:pimeloyl-ACP methyl ester carboxylesterase